MSPVKPGDHDGENRRRHARLDDENVPERFGHRQVFAAARTGPPESPGGARQLATATAAAPCQNWRSQSLPMVAPIMNKDIGMAQSPSQPMAVRATPGTRTCPPE